MISSQLSHHTLDFSIEGNGAVYHIIENFRNICPEFEIAGFGNFLPENFIFAHCTIAVLKEPLQSKGISVLINRHT
jgi:hypothetical protein